MAFVSESLGGSTSGVLETATTRSHTMSELGARLTLEAERRPPTFSRRRHGRHAGACRRQLGAALRPRARAGLEPQTCEVPSIHRPRWCAGRCAARGRLQWLQSFGTIVAVLAMPLQSAPSTIQVLHPPPARASCPQCSLTTGCTPCVAGGCLERQWKLLSMAAKRQHAAVSWQQAGARAINPAATAGLRRWLGGPRSRLGRQQVVEPAGPSYLAGPPGPTAEPGGLWSPWIRSRVRV